jgi:hypothetical protein
MTERRKTALTTDPVFFPVAGWGLPTDAEKSLAWFRKAVPREDTDQARLTKLMTFPSAVYMPDALKAQLASMGLRTS